MTRINQLLMLGTLGVLPALASPAPQHVPSHINLVHRSDPGAKLLRRGKYDTESISESEGFWFGSFDVGSSKNLHMLIDTGSSDVIVNKGYYTPGSSSVNLNLTFDNSYGTTESDGSGTGSVAGTLYNDTVSFGSLTATQTVGSANSSDLIPGDGIVGFAGVEVEQFPNGAEPFFHSLCSQGQVASCRFALVLGQNDTGIQVLGELDTSLFEGNLTTTSIIQEWVIFADVALNNTVITTNIMVELDSGTATVVGPVDEVLSIFEATSIQAVVQNTTDGVTVTGYFPCDSPPTLGFNIPSTANATAAAKADSGLISHQSKIFNIEGEQWIAADNGNNNCTAVLSGANVEGYPTLWVAGQAFFRGLYLDHNVANATIGLATAKNQSTTGSATSASGSASSTPSVAATSGAAAGYSMSPSALFFSAILGSATFPVSITFHGTNGTSFRQVFPADSSGHDITNPMVVTSISSPGGAICTFQGVNGSADLGGL
ncbi:acid protease [Aspergillus heteromorphus CBS 117.55]|uniref:Acid protease n=1 Tax=Aspergillus heteromorphus CBS 117.55 TaxID=1448321 RepID=A0A317WWA4_9EURO|nr:acid protease [Aspergillus heteromorphus CBS 117.55]PWY90676.1 acid protease [Aspergillus heteromorphus CBS 117.55]